MDITRRTRTPTLVLWQTGYRATQMAAKPIPRYNLSPLSRSTLSYATLDRSWVACSTIQPKAVGLPEGW